jgi:hypothetical protein
VQILEMQTRMVRVKGEESIGGIGLPFNIGRKVTEKFSELMTAPGLHSVIFNGGVEFVGSTIVIVGESLFNQCFKSGGRFTNAPLASSFC